MPQETATAHPPQQKSWSLQNFRAVPFCILHCSVTSVRWSASVAWFLLIRVVIQCCFNLAWQATGNIRCSPPADRMHDSEVLRFDSVQHKKIVWNVTPPATYSLDKHMRASTYAVHVNVLYWSTIRIKTSALHIPAKPELLDAVMTSCVGSDDVKRLSHPSSVYPVFVLVCDRRIRLSPVWSRTCRCSCSRALPEARRARGQAGRRHAWLKMSKNDKNRWVRISNAKRWVLCDASSPTAQRDRVFLWVFTNSCEYLWHSIFWLKIF